MALLDLKTNLKSLKYGQDQPGGGNSGQPYQQVDINKVDSGFNQFRLTKFDDGLVRGGAVGAANASIVDTLRIGKFLKDFPKGPLFIVKQVGLQLSNPQLETKKLKTDSPTRGNGLLRNVGNFILNTANKIVNAVGPTRIYNLGINTLAQVPVNAFGQHFNRHGLLPVQDDQTKYLAVAQNNNEGEGAPNNKLEGLRNRFGLGINYDLYKGNIKLRKKEQKTLSVIAATFEGGIPFANSVYNDIQSSRIADYIGGPNSVYGIGRTLIKRIPEHTNDNLRIEAAKNKKYNEQHIPTIDEKVRNGGFREASLYSTSTFTSAVSYGSISSPSNGTNEITKAETYSGKVTWTPSTGPKKVNKEADLEISKLSPELLKLVNHPLKTAVKYSPTDNSPQAIYSRIKETVDKRNNKYKLYTDKPGISPSGNASDLLEIINPVDDYNLPNPVRVNEMTSSYDGLTALSRNTNQNKVQLFPNYNSSKDTSKSVVTVNVNRSDKDFNYVKAELENKFERTNDTAVSEDKLALIFNPLDPFTGLSLKELKFLGYLTDYSEAYDSGWSDVKYVGRAENFYIFNSFKRSLNVGFNIPCFNKEELISKHCTLSELASTLAGKYQNNLLLGGIITKLKIGGYVDYQPGIINNLTFTPIQDSSWDLDEGIAFYIKVTFGFTLIHNFLPQHYDCGFRTKTPDPVPPQPDPKPELPPKPKQPDPKPVVKTINDIPPDRKDTSYTAATDRDKVKMRADALEKKKGGAKPFTKEQDQALRDFFNKNSRQ
jgi:hypothetical protein